MPRPSKGNVPAHLSLINSLLAFLLNEEHYIRTFPGHGSRGRCGAC